MTMLVASCVICPSVPAPVRAASRPVGSFPPVRRRSVPQSLLPVGRGRSALRPWLRCHTRVAN